jgi:hypothetical protein
MVPKLLLQIEDEDLMEIHHNEIQGPDFLYLAQLEVNT